MFDANSTEDQDTRTSITSLVLMYFSAASDMMMHLCGGEMSFQGFINYLAAIRPQVLPEPMVKTKVREGMTTNNQSGMTTNNQSVM